MFLLRGEALHHRTRSLIQANPQPIPITPSKIQKEQENSYISYNTATERRSSNNLMMISHAQLPPSLLEPPTPHLPPPKMRSRTSTKRQNKCGSQICQKGTNYNIQKSYGVRIHQTKLIKSQDCHCLPHLKGMVLTLHTIFEKYYSEGPQSHQ